MICARSIYATGAAAALMQLRLTAGASSITVFDNSASDTDPNLGFISYDQTALANDLSSLGFDRVNVQTGRCLTCAAAMTMSLVTGGEDDLGVPLIVEVWDYDFVLEDFLSWEGQQSASAILPIGSSIIMESFWSAADAPDSAEFQLGSAATFAGASGSETTFSSFPAALTESPFGMTLKMEFLSSSLGFDAQAQQNGLVQASAVPLPLAAPLLGVGLGGFFLRGARRRIGEMRRQA
ncbi:hypothetical protein [uncultured Albimonas sp.]|uniref:hypothetical protein n=1 Tax=uncultured Albimonas sp. TaxID=1331701 RepID=UPI0030EDA636